jgi:hypothetical protein
VQLTVVTRGHESRPGGSGAKFARGRNYTAASRSSDLLGKSTADFSEIDSLVSH